MGEMLINHSFANLKKYLIYFRKYFEIQRVFQGVVKLIELGAVKV